MSNSSKVLFALITGLAAGTALGIFIAPDEGQQSRLLFCKSVKGLSTSIREKAADEFLSLSGWKRRMMNLIKAQLFGPEPELPDDLEHG